MKIDSLVVRPEVERQLEAIIKNVPHAILLTGPEGTGKTLIADTLAATLLNKKLENNAHYSVIEPIKDSITIEQIRLLISFFRLKVSGKTRVKRVAVIRDADRMGHEAQNALLKLLEEPPEGSVLILTSSVPQQLLATIRSRVQLVQIAIPDHEQLLHYFATLGFDKEVVVNTLLKTGNNIAQTTKLLNEAGDADEILNVVKQALRGTSYERLLLVDGLAKQKEQACSFVDTLATVAEASLQIAATKQTTSTAKWQEILHAAYQAREALSQNGNTKLVLTELMLDM